MNVKNKFPKTVKLKTYLASLALVSIILVSLIAYSYSVSSGLQRSLFLDNIPSTASYIIDQETVSGVTYNFATRYDGKTLWYGYSASYVIQSAINALGTVGGKIFIKKGTYWISSTISLNNASNVLIEGEDIDAVILMLANGANCDIFSYTGTTLQYFFGLRDLTLHGYKAVNTAGHGIFVKYTPDDGRLMDITMEHVFLRDFAEDNIHIQTIWGLRLYDVISENSNSHGCYLGGWGTNAKLWGCKFNSNVGSGLVVWLSQISVIGCEMGENGIYGLDAGGSIYGLNVLGCALYNSVKHNLFLENTIGASILGNDMRNPGTGYYDVNIASVSSNNVITENYFSKCSDAGTNNIIRFNRGFVTENSGTATISSGNTYIWVAHGLAGTPTYVQLTPKNDLGGRSFWWNSANSTHFKIHISSADLTNNLSFTWEGEYKP